MLPLLALASGCAGGFSPATPLRIDTGPQTLHTSQPLALSASLSGEPAPARWSILSTTNAQSLGRGTLTSDGSSYIAPAILSHDQVTVILGAASGAQTAETTLTITPAFAQPLQPENATLPAGATIQIRAQLAEVSSGTVHWRLAAQSAAPGSASQDLGLLSGQHCARAYNQFTTCTVTYTAPTTQPLDAHVLVIATAPGLRAPARAVARLLLGSLFSNPMLHQEEQRPPIALGSSGSNDNDFDTFAGEAGARFVADCCGGTLGAIVEDLSGTPYLLSNNHVLATSDQGQPGDPIEHPGLIDDACVPLTRPGAQVRAIGNLRYAVPLSRSSTGLPGSAAADWHASNVDAALASLVPGLVDASGAILELAPENATLTASAGANTLRAAPPTGGTGEPLDAARLTSLRVAKSGRTTGLTCSSVEAIDLRITVDYYRDCAETDPYTTRTFTGQIGIGGDAFADAGDSGALLLDAANAQPIGLLYATATAGELPSPGAEPGAEATSSELAGTALSIGPGVGLTLANPIGDVLSEAGAQMSPATRLTVRGSATPHRLACLDYDTPAPRPSLSTLTPDERTRTAAAMNAATALHANPAVVSLAPGASEDSPGEGAILIYTRTAGTSGARPGAPQSIPATIAGVRTVLLPGDGAARNLPAPGEPDRQPGLHLTAAQLTLTHAAAERLAPALMATRAVFGVGVAQSLDNPSDPAILVLIDADASRLSVAQALGSVTAGPPPGNLDADADASPWLPATLGGLRARYLRIHRFRVTQSKYLAQGAPSSCSVRQWTTKR